MSVKSALRWLSLVILAVAVAAGIANKDVVGTYVLEFFVLGKVPFTDFRIGFFTSVMVVLSAFAIASFFVRSYSFELTVFKTKKNKELKARRVIQPTVDLQFEEAIEELETLTT